MNLSGAGRARGPAGLTVQGKKPTCTCAQMPPCAASPMDSGLWPLSLNMWSWFWGWHPCSPINTCCWLSPLLLAHHQATPCWGYEGCTRSWYGRDGGMVGEGRRGARGQWVLMTSVNGFTSAYKIPSALSNSGKITQSPQAS